MDTIAIDREKKTTDAHLSPGMKLSAVLLLVAAATSAQEHYKSDYFQYTNVRSPTEYAHGYSRGNPHHRRTHHERSKDHAFQAKVRSTRSRTGNGTRTRGMAKRSRQRYGIEKQQKTTKSGKGRV